MVVVFKNSIRILTLYHSTRPAFGLCYEHMKLIRFKYTDRLWTEIRRTGRDRGAEGSMGSIESYEWVDVTDMAAAEPCVIERASHMIVDSGYSL